MADKTDPGMKHVDGPTIRVGVAEDHQLVREALVAVLDAHRGISVVCAVDSGEHLLQAICNGPAPDVCVIDTAMPGMGGAETIRELAKGAAAMACVALAERTSPWEVTNLRRCGANCIISKESSLEQLVHAIELTATGQPCDAVGPSAPATEPGRTADGLADLSPREFEVLVRLARGERISDIASDLFVSPKTISTHRRRLLDKLGLGCNVELGMYALRHDLID